MRPRAGETSGAPRAGRTLLAAAAVVLAVLAAPRARADEADDLRSEMLGGGPGRWRAVFRRVEGDAALLARTLGPIFRDRGERVRAISVWAAAALADRAGDRNEEPLLADEILRRAAGELAYVVDVRGHLDGEGAGWPALVAAARRRLLDASADPADRSAAAFFLRYEPTKQNARDLAAAWESGPSQVGAAAADSLQWLLSTTFVDPAQARAFFDANDRGSFVDWMRAASSAKDRPDAPIRLRLVEEAKKNVERLGTPEELGPYLSVEATPYVEVRRAAAKRAARLDAPAEAWLPLLVQVVRTEDDQETLLGLLEVGKRLRLTDRGKAQDLARAILARLENRPSGAVALGLVNLLGTVADPKTAAAAFEVLQQDADGPMLDALLSLAGSVGGVEPLLVRFHAARAGATSPTDVRLRARALDALAQGARASADPEVAARYLRAVLRRDDADPSEASVARETSPEGRRAAILALQAFPGNATASRLGDVARAEAAGGGTASPDDLALARLALGVLGRFATAGDTAAASTVVGLAGDALLRAVRVDALKALARLPEDAAADLHAGARTVAREALGPASPRDVRMAAAEAAEALADPGALGGLLALALEQLRETPGSTGPVQPLLEGLLRRLARAGPDADDRIASTIRLLSAAGGVEAAVAAGDAAADEGQGRLVLQLVRAELAEALAAASPRSAERVRHLQDAERIVRTALAAVVPTERSGPTWSAALALRRSLLDGLIADEAYLSPDDRKQVYLARVEVGVVSGDPSGAVVAIDVGRRARALDLTPEEGAALDRDLETLRRLSPQ